eukprot:gene6100-12353_t
MAIETWVSLFRNFLCVCNSLVHPASWFRQPFLTNFRSPIANASIIELGVGTLQFAAVWFGCFSGLKNIYGGCKDYIWIVSVRKEFLNVIAKRKIPHLSIIKDDLTIAKTSAKYRIVTGIFELTIGLGYTFLGLNSFHIHFQTHPKPVIDALIFMEIALLYFLILMWSTFATAVKDNRRARLLADALNTNSAVYSSTSNLLAIIQKCGYSDDVMTAVILMDPLYTNTWRNGRVKFNEQNKSLDACLNKDLNKFDETLEKFCTIIKKEKKSDPNERKVDNKKELKQLQTKAENNRSSAAENLIIHSEVSSTNIPFNLLYFLLNCIAAYGYFLCILAFYVPENQNLDISQPIWYQIMKFGHSNAITDWWGNLIGDICWTIEPAVILSTSWLITHMNMKSSPKVQIPKKKTKGSNSKKNR